MNTDSIDHTFQGGDLGYNPHLQRFQERLQRLQERTDGLVRDLKNLLNEGDDGAGESDSDETETLSSLSSDSEYDDETSGLDLAGESVTNTDDGDVDYEHCSLCDGK